MNAVNRSEISVTRVLQSCSKLVDREIEREAKEMRLPSEFRHALRYCLNSGKRIRPSVVLLSCQAVGGKRGDATKAATSVEIMHCATLVYDDIIDQDGLRRKRPTLHIKFGQDVAIIVAGILVVTALNMVSRTREVFALLASLTEIGFGEAMELRSGVNDLAGYLFMIEKKTAALFKTAALMGAMRGNASVRERRALEAYGKNLGIAFQVRDDILGADGDAQILGKPVGSDLINGRPSIVSIILAKRLNLSLAELKKIAKDGGMADGERSKALQLSVNDAIKLSLKFRSAALAALDELPPSRYRRHLSDIVQFAVTRRA